jgi:hypothetical protein
VTGITAESTFGTPAISSEQRERFARLADEMIPAAPGMPSATAAHADSSGLDAVLSSRPDLAEPLRAALDELASAPAPDGVDSALALIRSPGYEHAWGILSSVVSSAYFLNPDVCAALGYPGQEAIPVDEQPDDIDPQQLAQVRERGAVYRPTPPESASYA